MMITSDRDEKTTRRATFCLTLALSLIVVLSNECIDFIDDALLMYSLCLLVLFPSILIMSYWWWERGLRGASDMYALVLILAYSMGYAITAQVVARWRWVYHRGQYECFANSHWFTYRTILELGALCYLASWAYSRWRTFRQRRMK